MPPLQAMSGDMFTESEVDVEEKVVVVGGGPAGLAAAIYAARAGLSPVVIAPSFGGQLLGKGVDVENFPGVVGAQVRTDCYFLNQLYLYPNYIYIYMCM